MSFLSIVFLAALPLAAAPILLHLFDRRRNVVIEWGAMQFLMEAATRRTSARKLKQWLLLLMRVLALAALVLSLSRPTLKGNWFGRNDHCETIFVVDNSMSMMRRADDGSLFDAAVERTIASLDDMRSGDSVRVLLASPYPVWAMGSGMRVDSKSRDFIADRLNELRPTGGGSDLLSALFTAVQAEIDPTQPRRRIVLLTDGQRSDWSTDDDAGWQRFRDVLQSAAIPTELDVVELDHEGDAQNIAVNRIRSSRTVVGVNQTFTLNAPIRNHGLRTSSAATAIWTIGGEVQHESHVPSLDGGRQHDVVWKHSFAETGVYAVSCRIDGNDDLEPDNQATVVVEVVQEIPVILVETAADLAEMQRDAFFVEAALRWIDGEPLNQGGVHVPLLADPARLARIDLKEYRAVVVPNLTRLSDDVVDRLRDFVSSGGGLWVALGPRTDIDAFNQLFFADGDGLAPLAIDRIVHDDESRPDAEGRTQQTRIDPFGREHPATAELADNERLDTGDVTVAQRFRFVPPPEGEDVSVLLSLTNGEPLAVEKYVGRGRVIVQSIPLRLQWSELARSQAFVVMVQDWLAYLTEPRATRHNLSPGDPISVQVADSQTRDATLRTPHGDEIELTADETDDGVVFRSSRTILPGDYSLELGLSGDEIPFQVNRDVEESDLTPLTDSDQERLAELAGLSRNTASAVTGGTNQTDPLWPILLMILIALIAAELLLSGMIARERFGSDPISETTELHAEQPIDLPSGFGAKTMSSTRPEPIGRKRSAEPVTHKASTN